MRRSNFRRTRGRRRTTPRRSIRQPLCLPGAALLVPNVNARLRNWAKGIKRDLTALYLALRDPRVPWYVKLLAGGVIAYAVSPIDLIPDFVPILGYLDDLIIVPLGMILVIRLMPPGLIDEYRAQAAQVVRLPTGYKAAMVIVAVWGIVALLLAVWLFRRLWPVNFA